MTITTSVVTELERSKTMDEYPYYSQCIRCKYWKRMNNGERFTKKSVYSKRANQLSALPCCHYAIDTNNLREEKNGICLSFHE